MPRTRNDSTGKSTPNFNADYIPPTPLQLYKRISQSRNTTYKAEAIYSDALVVLTKQSWLNQHEDDTTDVKGMSSSMDPEYEIITMIVPILQSVDFSPLLWSCLSHAEHAYIKKEWVHLVAACAVHSDLDVNLVMRYLSGEYTAKWHNIDTIMADIELYVSLDDIEHIWLILTKGCPEKSIQEEPANNNHPPQQ